jgi:DNA-binding transcriptional LysR family regulator
VLDNSVLQAQTYIAVIAEEGSFSRAAKRLHTAQSFLTRRIAKVERELQTKIFERSTRRIELTTIGRILLPEIQLSIRHSERAWELARHYSRLINGPIRVGYSSYTNDVPLRILQQLDMSEFEAQQVGSGDSPEPRLVFENSSTPELIERVLRGKLHISLGIHPIPDRDLWIEPIAQESFCLCLPKGHMLAQRTVIAAREMDGQPVFWMPRDVHPAFYKRTTEYVRSTGARPLYKETRSIAQAIEMVSHGLGIALLPQSASRLSCAGVVFKPVTDRYLQIETALFARRELMHDSLRDFALFLASRLQGSRFPAS